MPTKEKDTEKDYFVFSVTEKIGLPQYSSVEFFTSLSRSIDDTDEARQEVIDLVEQIASVERGKILDSLGVEAK